MASSAFSKALAGKKASIEKMRNSKPKQGYTPPKIENGNYIFAVDAECGVTEAKGVPYVKFNWSIQDEGEYFGKSNNMIIWLDGFRDDESEDKTFDRLAKTFMALLDLEEVNVEDPQDIEQLVDMVNQEKIYCRGNLSNWTSSTGKTGFNVYFNKKVEAVEA